MKPRDLAACALFSALTAVFSIIAVPLPGGVPITLSIMAVFISGALLSPKYAALSQCVYLLMGVAGLPVFAGFKGGLAVLAGPTGGYLIVYPVMAAVVSLIRSRLRIRPIFADGAAMLVSLAICYAFGCVWFSIFMRVNIVQSFLAAVAPFVVFDLLKAAAGAFLASAVRKAAPSLLLGKGRA